MKVDQNDYQNAKSPVKFFISWMKKKDEYENEKTNKRLFWW